MLRRQFVIGAVDKEVALLLIPCNAELGGDIFLNIVIVAVQVVRSDIGQYGYICPEIVHIIQLEAA